MYDINLATEKDILLHLKDCDTQFVPALSSRVELNEYAQKLLEKSVTFEAWDNARLIGLIGVYFNDKSFKQGYISNVSVSESFKKNGIAGTLLKRTIEYALEQNFETLTLEVNKRNLNAVSFYKKYNFETCSQDDEVFRMKCEINE